jgi:hypothetical protein
MAYSGVLFLDSDISCCRGGCYRVANGEEQAKTCLFYIAVLSVFPESEYSAFPKLVF